MCVHIYVYLHTHINRGRVMVSQEKRGFQGGSRGCKDVMGLRVSRSKGPSWGALIVRITAYWGLSLRIYHDCRALEGSLSGMKDLEKPPYECI